MTLRSLTATILITLAMLFDASPTLKTRVDRQPQQTVIEPSRREPAIYLVDSIARPDRPIMIQAVMKKYGQPVCKNNVVFKLDGGQIGRVEIDRSGRASLALPQASPGMHVVEAVCEAEHDGETLSDTGIILVRSSDRPLVLISLDALLASCPGSEGGRAAALPGAQAASFELKQSYDVAVLCTIPVGSTEELRKCLQALSFPRMPLINPAMLGPSWGGTAYDLAAIGVDWGGIALAIVPNDAQAEEFLSHGIRVITLRTPAGNKDWDRALIEIRSLLRSQGW